MNEIENISTQKGLYARNILAVGVSPLALLRILINNLNFKKYTKLYFLWLDLIFEGGAIAILPLNLAAGSEIFLDRFGAEFCR